MYISFKRTVLSANTRVAALAEGSSVPLWERISLDLAHRVEDGEFAEGFPGEFALATSYGVSRGTIRSALRPLRDRGAVSSHRGQKPRVIVGGASVTFGPVYSLFDAVQASSMSQRSIVLSQGAVTDALVAGHLAMEAATELFRLSRVRLADERPLAIDHVWLPASRVRSLANVDFSNTALYKELQDRCGITLDGGREELHAETATESLAALLQCRPGAPLFRIERIGCHRGERIEFRRTHILGERYVASASFGVSPPTA